MYHDVIYFEDHPVYQEIKKHQEDSNTESQDLLSSLLENKLESVESFLQSETQTNIEKILENQEKNDNKLTPKNLLTLFFNFISKIFVSIYTTIILIINSIISKTCMLDLNNSIFRKQENISKKLQEILNEIQLIQNQLTKNLNEKNNNSYSYFSVMIKNMVRESGGFTSNLYDSTKFFLKFSKNYQYLLDKKEVYLVNFDKNHEDDLDYDIEILFELKNNQEKQTNLLTSFLAKYDTTEKNLRFFTKIRLYYKLKTLLLDFNEFEQFWTEVFTFYKNTVNNKLIFLDQKKKGFCNEEQKCLKKITILGICQLNDPDNLDINVRLRENQEKYNNLVKYQHSMLIKDNPIQKIQTEEQNFGQVNDKNMQSEGNLNDYVIYEVQNDQDNISQYTSSSNSNDSDVSNKNLNEIKEIDMGGLGMSKNNFFKELQESIKEKGRNTHEDTTKIKKIKYKTKKNNAKKNDKKNSQKIVENDTQKEEIKMLPKFVRPEINIEPLSFNHNKMGLMNNFMKEQSFKVKQKDMGEIS